jgi:hypothetical protein
MTDTPGNFLDALSTTVPDTVMGGGGLMVIAALALSPVPALAVSVAVVDAATVVGGV